MNNLNQSIDFETNNYLTYINTNTSNIININTNTNTNISNANTNINYMDMPFIILSNLQHDIANEYYKELLKENAQYKNNKTEQIKSPDILYDMSLKNTDFIEFLNNKIDKIMNEIDKNINKHKLYKCNKNFDINLLDKNYENLLKYNLNMNELKNIAKKKNIKFSNVNKITLLKNIFFNLYYSCYIVKIQRVFRKYLHKYFRKVKGPAFINRKLSLNTSDFITLEDISEIHPDEFFSFDCGGKEIYSFNINSIFSYIFTNNKTLNPYNRKLFPINIIELIEKYITLSKCLNKQINSSSDSLDINKFNKNKQLEFRTLALFQMINELDNYSDPKWFLNLSFKHTKRFIDEFRDIWDYRAELTYEMKRDIYPPDGHLFKSFNLNYLIKKNDIIYLKNNILQLFENLIHSNSTIPNKKLAVMYILTALTIVSDSAANSMPYYYYSVV